ncbi:MAG: hypothetical protein ACTHM6_15800 [Tepidisphaeraceae bacterium]
MDEIELIRQLAERAGEAPTPRVDVATDVLTRIRRRPVSTGTRAWAVTAAVGMVVAVGSCVMAAGSWGSLANPLADLGMPEAAGGVR